MEFKITAKENLKNSWACLYPDSITEIP